MRKTVMLLTSAAALVAAAVALPVGIASAASGPSAAALALARQSLPANDGWAAAGTGTTGGSAAADTAVFVVHTRDELAAAVAGNTPKIVFVGAHIEGNVDANNQPLTCDSYNAPGYSLSAYLAAYDPAVWGTTTRPSGPLEDARAASQKNQAARVVVNVGSNTT